MAPFSFADAKIKSFFYTARLFEEKYLKKVPLALWSEAPYF